MKLFSKNLSRSFLFLGLLFILIIPVERSHAQTTDNNGLTMTVQPGFDGIIKNDNWFPVLVTLANDGVAVEGTLELSFGDSGTTWATNVSLPTQSRKQIQTTVYASESIQAFKAVLRSDETGEPLLSSSNNSLKRLDPADSLIYAVVSPEPDTLEQLEKVRHSRADAAVAYLAIDEIPTDPIALQPLDVLVFNDTDTNSLSAGQRESIEIWLRQGGQLVLTGGSGWQKTTAAFSHLLPVEIVATESISTLSNFESAIGSNFRDAGPYVIARSSLKNGELVWRDEAQPILARRAEGAGNVWFLALDPQFAPLDDWDGSLVLWDSVAQFVPHPLFWERGFDSEDSLYEAVSTIPTIQLPSVWLILGFMGLYVLVVGPLNYIVLSQMDRRELAWLTLPITILLFSGVALLIGLQFRGNRVIVNQLSVVSGRIDASELKVESGIGIYSPRRDEYDITFTPDTGLKFVSRFGLSNLSDSLRVTLGNENVLEDVLVAVGEVTPLTASSFQDASPISGRASLSADKKSVELSVTNDSPDTIRNILLLVGTKQIQLKNLNPGQTISQQIDIPSASQKAFETEASGSPETYQVIQGQTDITQDSPLENGFPTLIEGESPGGYTSYYYYDDPEESQRYNLLSSLYETYNSDTVYTPTGKIIFIGWSEAAQIDISLNSSRFDLAASSLYFIEIPVEK
ncbi:MAG: hypothetical protein ACI9EW_000860 [Cellvibrionaceae bacterium]|jgi:hypothetical protein